MWNILFNWRPSNIEMSLIGAPPHDCTNNINTSVTRLIIKAWHSGTKLKLLVSFDYRSPGVTGENLKKKVPKVKFCFLFCWCFDAAIHTMTSFNQIEYGRIIPWSIFSQITGLVSRHFQNGGPGTIWHTLKHTYWRCHYMFLASQPIRFA